MTVKQYRLVRDGVGTLHSWTEPPTIEAIKQIMIAGSVDDPTTLRIVKEIHVKHTLKEWFFQYHKEI